MTQIPLIHLGPPPDDDTGNRDHWATPQHVVDAVSAVMGRAPIIDLCASADNAKAELWIGEYESHVPELDNPTDGLLSIPPEWIVDEYLGASEWAWLQPPYSHGNMPKFTSYAADLVVLGCTVVMLSMASQSDGWWRENVAPYARMIMIPDRRIQFIPPEGVKSTQNSTQNAISVMAPRRPWDGETVVRRLMF